MDDGDSQDERGPQAAIVDRWLQPLDGDDPCGEDLEYDNAFLELTKAAAGKPETQFSAAEPPDWRRVIDEAESLFERTRDMRIAALWVRAQVGTEGWSALPEGLRLLHGLLESQWEGLHPRPDPDDGDAYARVNVLEGVGAAEGLCGDLREAQIVGGRPHVDLRGRHVEIALDRLAPRPDESPPERGQVEQMLAEAAAENPAVARLSSESLERLDTITALMRDHVGYERAPTFDTLRSLLEDLQQLLPSPEAPSAFDSGDDMPAGSSDGDGFGSDLSAAPSGGRGLGDAIESRDDALRAIDMVCDFLERTEPTNPAQLLLRRAQRLVNKNFLELVHELAPEALAGVARVMGVAPESIAGGDGSSEDGES